MANKCTCGRSTTGDCLGWHNLSNEEYARVRDEADRKALDEKMRMVQESAPQLLNE